MRRLVDGRLGAVLLPVLGLAVLIAVWWLGVLAFHVQPFILPTPWQVAKVFIDSPGDLLGHLRASTVETLEGYALAVVVGLAIALAVVGSRVVDRMFSPLLVGANAIPKVALAPLVLVWFGLDQLSRVVLVFLVCFFPIVVSAVTGFTTTPADLAELARSLSASRRQTFLKVRVPAALPHIFIGLKVALTLAVIGATVAELSGATEGLMYAVQSYSGQGATAPAVAALVLLAALSIVLYYLLVAVERRLLPWARATSG
ncbi:MAG: ABC transporter permease [Actinobacteria bacterium]|nr:MAG: ABC transporter permease [Actinomycetota bacterium]